jgi:Ca2+/Na+ antiporter
MKSNVVVVGFIFGFILFLIYMIKKSRKNHKDYSQIYSSSEGEFVQKRFTTCEKCCHTYEPLPECKDIHENRLVKCGRESENCNIEQQCLTDCLKVRGNSQSDIDFCRHVECG